MEDSIDQSGNLYGIRNEKNMNEAWPLGLEDQWGVALSPAFYTSSAPILASDLLGKIILSYHERGWLVARICETEAYTQDDPASHTYKGINARNQAMFKAGGTIYVYRTYGLHWCMNISSGAEGQGEAVLIRAIEALAGLTIMRQLRGLSVTSKICDTGNGPGKLTQALAIDARHNGIKINSSDVLILDPHQLKGYEAPSIMRGTRIGISRAQDVVWRFAIKNHPCLSRSFPAEASGTGLFG